MRFQILTILSITYVIELQASKKLDIDADTRKDPTFFEYIKQGLDEELELKYFSKRSDDDDDGPIMEVIKDNALHELLQENLPEITSGGDKLLVHIQNFESRSEQKGVDSIQAIANHVQQKLNISHADLTPIVKETTSDYISMIKKYFSDLAREKPSTDVEKEYIILDMINVVSLIRSKSGKNVLKRILDLAKSSDNEEIEILTGTLLMFNDNDKQQEMDFMCANYRICRPNPTFSDYLFRLLENVLMLHDKKFHHFFIKSSQLLLTKRYFFETVLQNEIVNFLQEKMSNVATMNVTELRKIVSFLHSILLRRYKIKRRNDIKIQIKAKSAYIILDIADTAFGIDGKDLYGPHMEKMTGLIREWSTSITNEIEIALRDLIQYVVEAMNYNFNKRAKEEIKTLADILFYDKSENQNVTEYLLTKGSKFVIGLVNQPELKKLW